MSPFFWSAGIAVLTSLTLRAIRPFLLYWAARRRWRKGVRRG